MSGKEIFDDVPEERRRLMGRVRAKGSVPEMRVRRLSHRLGYRHRLHRKGLPGTPDLVYPSIKKAVFVHGCFWHRHLGCRQATTPKTRAEYWLAKFEANVARDEAVQRNLKALGWEVLVIWECETRNAEGLRVKLATFLSKCRKAEMR